jgi:hypothetical protein
MRNYHFGTFWRNAGKCGNALFSKGFWRFLGQKGKWRLALANRRYRPFSHLSKSFRILSLRRFPYSPSQPCTPGTPIETAGRGNRPDRWTEQFKFQESLLSPKIIPHPNQPQTSPPNLIPRFRAWLLLPGRGRSTSAPRYIPSACAMVLTMLGKSIGRRYPPRHRRVHSNSNRSTNWFPLNGPTGQPGFALSGTS